MFSLCLVVFTGRVASVGSRLVSVYPMWRQEVDVRLLPQLLI